MALFLKKVIKIIYFLEGSADEIWIFFVVFIWEMVIYFPFFSHKLDHLSIMENTADT